MASAVQIASLAKVGNIASNGVHVGRSAAVNGWTQVARSEPYERANRFVDALEV